jgi:hypothetical protein
MPITKEQILSHIADLESKYGIPQGAFKQIVKIESNFKPGLTSPAGAYGLSQLMPQTAKGLGVDINDPYSNLEGGAKYYKQLLDKFEGNPVIAAGAYNSGPNKRAYKVRDTRMLPPETQNYMKKFYNEYVKPLGNSIIKPANADETPYSPTVPKKTYTTAELDAMEQQPNTPKKTFTTAELDAMEQGNQPTETPKPYSFSDLNTYIDAAKNLPASALKLGSGTIDAITEPVDTIKAIDDMIMGTMYRAIPSAADEVSKENPESVSNAIQASKNMQNVILDRYGSIDAAANTFATDPAGMIADLSPLGKGSKLMLENRVAQGAVSPAGSLSRGIAGASNVGIDIMNKLEPYTKYISSPISSIAAKASDVFGNQAVNVLGNINKSNLTKADINKAYEAGRFNNYANTVSSKPLIPDFKSMSPAELAGMIGSAGLLTPLSVGAYSPKLVAASAYGTGVGRKTLGQINKQVQSVPEKGLLNEYLDTQDPNRNDIHRFLQEIMKGL